jgi:hypothetical protein
MSTNPRRAAVGGVTAAALLIAALTGCGQGPEPPSTSSDPSASPTPTAAADPEELLQEAVDNMLDAPSKRLTGTAGIASVSTQDLEIIYVGDDARGTKVERATDVDVVSEVQFVKVDGSLYIFGDEPYWQWYVGLQDLYLVVRHWVRVPADHPEHSKLLVLKDDGMPWEPVGELTQEEGDAGAAEIVLVDSAGNRFTVGTDGTPCLVRVELTQTNEAGVATADMRFTDFGMITETITAPTDDFIEFQ